MKFRLSCIVFLLWCLTLNTCMGLSDIAKAIRETNQNAPLVRGEIKP